MFKVLENMNFWVLNIPKHDHGLLANIVRVLRNYQIDILIINFQFSGELDPVMAKEVRNIRYSER